MTTAPHEPDEAHGGSGMPTLPDHIGVPHPDRLHPDRADYELILTIHADAVRRDVDGYLDPATGAWVFTAAYLEERDFCCEMGCRHCPWIERP